MVLRILTIGDGDLSFSLALKRAYPHIDLTASTLVESSAELTRTYSNAAVNETELQNTWGVPILFNVDATRLDKTLESSCSKYGLIMFNHPHLGDSTLGISEKLHAQRHYSLLCHYFHSAKKFLTDQSCGRIHVCLCGTQPTTWNLDMAAKRNGLNLISQEGTETPIESWLFHTGKVIQDGGLISPSPEPEHAPAPAPVQKHYPCPRRYRNGKLGSKHYLGKYGYRHRRTGGDLFCGNDNDMSVHQSINYIFECHDAERDLADDDGNGNEDAHLMEANGFVCEICEIEFDDEWLLKRHLDYPAVPDILTSRCSETGKSLSSCDRSQSSLPSKDPSREDTEDITTWNSSCDQIHNDCHHGSLDRSLILIEGKVDGKFDSTRIKWLCRQKDFSLSKYITSKKQCVDAISQGRIYVNGVVALDSGRIVREDDVITLIDATTSHHHHGEQIKSALSIPTSAATENLGCRVVEEISLQMVHQSLPRFVVVYKPVGIRVVGSFSPQTLEMITKRLVKGQLFAGMENISCTALSKLDTGCAGLCVFLVDSKEDMKESNVQVESYDVQITYKFTALVYGRVPEEWRHGVYVKLPRNTARVWKRQKLHDKDLNEVLDCDVGKVIDNDEKIEITPQALDLDSSIFIMSKDSYSSCDNNDITSLDTIEISSRYGSGKVVNTISFILRKMGYPVVNDRFCKREFAMLPRRMRNILKQKICIGCYSVCLHLQNIVHKEVKIEPHRRTQASFWRQVMSNTGDSSVQK
eukprot:CAMPEP_0176489698 /NCGR_PEP_ID=MMETSP0200_2-20121128/7444_1 /TAXON_ID=947934 /ORGANISM="Chaetoceros sp., Strain GSL56" /LENGTH=752 /DNA_ID=CAMNT_0017886891 /DNA_START=7 /DNA_END=2265 /DNA_ORIENTATION=-